MMTVMMWEDVLVFLSLKTNYFVLITLLANNQQIINGSCSQWIDYNRKNWKYAHKMYETPLGKTLVFD
jgi:hypothetical protein